MQKVKSKKHTTRVSHAHALQNGPIGIYKVHINVWLADSGNPVAEGKEKKNVNFCGKKNPNKQMYLSIVLTRAARTVANRSTSTEVNNIQTSMDYTTHLLVVIYQLLHFGIAQFLQHIRRGACKQCVRQRNYLICKQ